MQSEKWLQKLMEPYGLSLADRERGQTHVYLELLKRWNQHVNLVAAASEETWVRRHFIESLYLSRFVTLQGRLLDVGSGAGFPVLPLKIAWPMLSVTLLEPVAKKRAFLKEVVRACELEGVEIRSERIEDFMPRGEGLDAGTSRAVGHFAALIPQMVRCLKDGARMFLWVSARQGEDLQGVSERIAWERPIDIPGTAQSQIWHGIYEARRGQENGSGGF